MNAALLLARLPLFRGLRAARVARASALAARVAARRVAFAPHPGMAAPIGVDADRRAGAARSDARGWAR